jgi:heptosyltransferase-2
VISSSRKRGFLHILSGFEKRFPSLFFSHPRELDPAKTLHSGKVLVIMLTHLGDVAINLFVLDAIAAAARCFDIVVKPPLDQLVRSHPGVRKVFTFACPWMGASRWPYGAVEWFKTIRRLRQNEYDIAIVTHPHELSSLTARLSGSKVTAGRAYSGDLFLDIILCTPQYRKMDQHASNYGLQLLEFLGIPTVAKPEQFPASRDDFGRGKNLVEKINSNVSGSGSRTVVIHPGAGGENRIWPKENFISVIDQLIAWRHTVVLVGGKIEKTICADIEEAFSCPEKLKNLSGQLNIGELCGVISAADIFVGHDSGPSHIAGALGVKSCIIFGPSDPAIWAPKGPGVTVLHFTGGEFRSPGSISRVVATIESLLPDTGTV